MIDQQLGALEIAGSDADIIICPRVVEFCKTPIDEAQLKDG